MRSMNVKQSLIDSDLNTPKPDKTLPSEQQIESKSHVEDLLTFTPPEVTSSNDLHGNWINNRNI